MSVNLGMKLKLSNIDQCVYTVYNVNIMYNVGASKGVESHIISLSDYIAEL